MKENNCNISINKPANNVVLLMHCTVIFNSGAQQYGWVCSL